MSTHETYQTALAQGRELGAGACGDAAAMALFCDAPLQLLVGAVSPQLVWEGAIASGLTLAQLGRLAAQDRDGVEALMWV